MITKEQIESFRAEFADGATDRLTPSLRERYAMMVEALDLALAHLDAADDAALGKAVRLAVKALHDEHAGHVTIDDVTSSVAGGGAFLHERVAASRILSAIASALRAEASR